MRSFDIIIVGAGPAGSLLGYYLALMNINVLIIDKQKLPRYKVCGGGLSRRSLDALPFDISEVIETFPSAVDMTLTNNIVFSYFSGRPVIGMVMRDTFDFFLVKKAENAGAIVLDETAFKSISGTAGNLIVETSNGTFKTKIIAGADGIHGKTARALNLNIKCRHMIGLEAEIYPDDRDTFNKYKRCVSFDLGVIPKGYGWIFPKKNHLSVGVVSASSKIKGMKLYLCQYLDTKNLNHLSTITSLKGWKIPYAPHKNSLYANNKGLLIGDAAGLSDPITGEGMYYALKEANIASQIIADTLKLGKGGLHVYNSALEAIRKDLSYAVTLQKMLYAFPNISRQLMTAYGNRLGKKYLDIITGKTTYVNLYRKIFSINGIKSLYFFQRNNDNSSVNQYR